MSQSPSGDRPPPPTPAPALKAAAARPHVFRMRGLMLLVALLALCCSVLRSVPALWFLLLYAGAFASIRLQREIAECEEAGLAFARPARVACYLNALTLALAVGLGALGGFLAAGGLGYLAASAAAMSHDIELYGFKASFLGLAVALPAGVAGAVAGGKGTALLLRRFQA